MANVLYFFPMNPHRVTAGNEQRARTLLTYFRDKGHTVDFVSSNDYWGGVIAEQDILSLKQQRLIRHHFSLSKKPHILGIKDFLRFEIIRFIRKQLKPKRSGISNFTTDYSRSQFNKVIKTHSYDYIVISYAFWADLVKNNRNIGHSTMTIIDAHDFITAQEQPKVDIKLGSAFSDEIERLRVFDEIWAVSADEYYVFSQLCRKPVRLIPICADADSDEIASDKEFDLIFVGGDNPHNVKSIQWFFDEVYPKLPPSLRICIVGKINTVLPVYPNVVKIKQAVNLGAYYRKSRIAICPMLSGTGTKVKVIEALAYGLPVVCSPRGVDGLLNKRDNGCLIAETAESFANLIQRLSADMDFYASTQNQAISYHKKYHSLRHLYRVLDEVFDSSR
ncbi:glycosyltransferase [Parapedobacter tibetensis]|uniref:glycosyltransferase n=1 Tax=Parapedobacter tibetensis TaxID=2972951 RepID=UPI00214DDA09|nr:glycosyltransferase family 4 protein [Parapedobacter tibetensis]